MERQEAVKELMDRMDVTQSARAILSTLPDLERLLSKQVEILLEIINSVFRNLRNINTYISIILTEYTLKGMLLE